MLNLLEFQIDHPEIFKRLAVKDLMFVYYRCPQIDKIIQLHIHYNLITFTLSGSRIIHQDDKTFICDENSTYFLRKTGYIQELPKTQNWEVLAFYIPDEFLVQITEEFGDQLPVSGYSPLTNDMAFTLHINEVTRAYLYSIMPYFSQEVAPPEKLLELKFKELLLNILINPENKELLSFSRSLKGNSKTPIWQVMEKNYIYNLKISEYARISNRSLASFKRDFFEHYHMTPGKWLTKKRLERARLLLNSSNVNISDVAFNTGFENVSHFCRVFKDKFGSSPQQYRKSILKIA